MTPSEPQQSAQPDASMAGAGRSRARTARRSATALLLPLLLSGFSIGTAQRAQAITIDFESVAPGSDAATIGASGLRIGGALVLSESFVEALLGYPAAGTWNTTPDGGNGALNTLAARITLDFEVPIDSFAVDVLALPDGDGEPGQVRIDAWAGDVFVASALSEPAALGDSGLPEATLSLAGSGITRIEIGPALGACLACPALPTSVWIDALRFEPIPEPATAVLLGLTLAALAANRRTR